MKSSMDCEAIEARDAEDREEGEIVDDDLEDISDNSIISTTLCNGKSLSSTDRLPAISLSSVTDESSPQLRRKRKRCAHRRDSRHSRKKRRVRKKSSDSEDEEVVDKSLQFKLKAAVCVDAKTSRRNSLQTRLKAMTMKNTEAADEKIENVNLVSSEAEGPNDDDVELDNELMQLRLEALQTAIYNKYKDKKRKNNGDNTDETNKENSGGNGTEAVKEPENTPPSPDEDEDILRALLLASMSKKITNKIDVGAEKPAPKLYAAPNYKLNHLKSKPATVPKFPQVRPLIINLNDDSDTDDDFLSDKIVKVDKVIENTVEKFLKEQREKVETESKKAPVKAPTPPKKLVPNVYASGKMVATRKTSLKLVNRKLTTPLKPKKPALFNKSTLSLLPEDKRREYEKLQLLLTLKRAERRPRVRRLSQRVAETSGAKCKPARPKTDAATATGPKTTSPTKEDGKKADSLQLLQGALKEMQYRKNGSLQIHARYGGLRPLIKKIDQFGKEEKQWNQQIKRLLEELAEARKRQQVAHANMSNAIRRLVQWKGKIDRSAAKAPVTSTPVKKDAPPLAPPVSVANKQIDNKEPRENDTTDNEINSGDPNDIDRIISKSSVTPVAPVPPPLARVSDKMKYVSPLDPVKRSGLNDPFSIMCPFEVDGTCKDPDCTYQHFVPPK